MSLVIRDLLAFPAALDTVAAWIDAQWSEFSGRTLQQTRERFTKDVRADRLPITLVALEDLDVAGVASLREQDSFDFLPGATPWICNVYVGPRFRGRGVAGALCGALLTKAAMLGFKNVYLATTFAEDSLYHQMGFQEVQVVWAHEEELHVLRRRLGA